LNAIKEENPNSNNITKIADPITNAEGLQNKEEDEDGDSVEGGDVIDKALDALLEAKLEGGIDTFGDDFEDDFEDFEENGDGNVSDDKDESIEEPLPKKARKL